MIGLPTAGGHRHVRLLRQRTMLLLPAGALIGLALAFMGQGSVILALVVVGGLVAVGMLVARGPLVCLVALTFFAVLGWSPTIMRVGAIDLTPLDVFYVALVIAVALAFLSRSEEGASRPRADVGQRAIWIFVLVLGIGILAVYWRDPGAVSGSFVSWFRLAQTVTLMSLIPAIVKTRDDLALVLRVVALSGFVSLLLAVNGLTGARDAISGIERAGTFLSSNSVGLLAAMLLLLALHSPVPSATWQRIGLGVMAVFGMVASKSIGSLIAVAVVLTVAGFSSRSPGVRVREHALFPLVIRVLAVGVVLMDLALVLRPESLPGRLEFTSSTTMHRVLVGAAGLEIFRHHPVIGVGWQQSSKPEYIGDPEINRALGRRFPDAYPHLFPDVRPTSVHNLYIQTLAEAGIIGFIVLMGAFAVTFGRIRSLVRRLEGDQWAYQTARFLALSLLLMVIWLNENSLFGGQLPTNLIVLVIGLAGALARITQPPAPSPDRLAVASLETEGPA